MPSVRVGAMRPISPGGTAVERRAFQRSSTDCIFIVFQAITRFANRLSASATGLHLLVLFGLVAGDTADVDSALQGIDGLAAVEHAQQLAAKGFVDEVVAQEHSAQQFAHLHHGLIERVAASGGPVPGQDGDRAAVAAMYGGK